MLKLSRPAALVAALLCLPLVNAPGARAQERDAPKFEVGAHFTSLELNPPDNDGTATKPGVGGRFAYNATDHLGLEGEINFLPQRSFLGRNVQGQFGVKAGKRWGKFGVFAKARPGFVSFSDVPTVVGMETFTDPQGRTFTVPVFGQKRQTHLSFDLGGVAEFYPSRRLLVRVDAGDTMIRFRREELPPNAGIFPPLPDGLSHSFQLSAGVAYRFHDPEGADASDPPAPEGGAPRFEAGVQYTTLFQRQPTRLFGFPFDTGFSVTLPEPAVGGRLTVNLNDHFAIEGAVDFLTKERPANAITGGIGIQGQFGVKAGRRFERFGLFAKARPGFLTYGGALLITGTRDTGFVDSSGRPVTAPAFEIGRRTHFETDLGGVVEFYPTRRVVTRFDLGDTIIRYGERNAPSFLLGAPIIRAPAETKHNFQFSAGVGVRF